MSGSFSAGSASVPASEISFDDLELNAEATSLDACLEQARALRGALNFLTALIAFYGEVAGHIELDAGEPAVSKRPPLQ